MLCLKEAIFTKNVRNRYYPSLTLDGLTIERVYLITDEKFIRL